MQLTIYRGQSETNATRKMSEDPSFHRLHSILEPARLREQGKQILCVLQQGSLFIPIGSSIIIKPLLKIGNLKTTIRSAKPEVKLAELEEDGDIIAVSGRSTELIFESQGSGKLAIFIMIFK